MRGKFGWGGIPYFIVCCEKKMVKKELQKMRSSFLCSSFPKAAFIYYASIVITFF